LLSLFIAACGSSGGGGSDDGDSDGQASLNLELLQVASLTSPPSTRAVQSNRTRAAIASGQVTASNLESLEYYITDISICKSMTINGTGYSNQSGCISVFSAETPYDYDTFVAEDAAQETEHYVDLMSVADLSKLSKTTQLSDDDVGDYYYGKVDHYRPVKLTAAIQLSDDTMVYTKSGTATLISGSGIDAAYVTRVSDITTGPAQESIVVLPNGGSWFKFEKPFSLTAEDIQNETSFQMKLAFNPEGVLKAYNYTSSNQVIQDEENNYGIVVPLMPFTPVIFRSTETAKKESYRFSYTSTDESQYNAFDFRLELYTVEEDASNSVYAADTLQLLLKDDEGGGSGSGFDVTQVFRPFSVAASTDDPPVYSFVNWLNNNFITEFSRGTHVGDTSSAIFHVDPDNAIVMDVLLRSIETIAADSTVETISLADLAGRWTGDCMTIDGGSRRDRYDFSGGGLLRTSIYYTDGACLTEKERLVQNQDVRLINKTTTAGGDAVKQINLVYNSILLTPKTTERADELSGSSHCSYDNWQVEEARELLGQDRCLDISLGEVIYDIYLVSGTDLFFGTAPATISEARPAELSDTATASYAGDIPAAD
jgi:hypothetical protein